MVFYSVGEAEGLAHKKASVFRRYGHRHLCMKGEYMFGLGPMELTIILIIILIIFGAGRLPEIGSGIGKGIRNFKKSVTETENGKLEDDEKTDDKKDDA